MRRFLGYALIVEPQQPFSNNTVKILQAYPTTTLIHGEIYRYERILKDDFFSVNVLYRNDQGERYVLKLSDCRFMLGLLFRPFAHLLCRHEYNIYQRVTDIRGVPPLGPRFGKRGFFHKYIEGFTLYELDRNFSLPKNFFEDLRRIVENIHQRRILYLDLQKLGNVILSCDGYPYLIDFQICLHWPARKGLFGRWADVVFNRLAQEDMYHLYKHKRRFKEECLTEEELHLSQRSSLNSLYGFFIGKPLRVIKRLIYPKGSNETPWYKWKRVKHKSRRGP